MERPTKGGSLHRQSGSWNSQSLLQLSPGGLAIAFARDMSGSTNRISSRWLAPEDESGLLPVLDNRGIPMGTALYSASSQIALRLISREIIDDEEWLELVRSRLIAAIDRRKQILSLKDTDACRLVFSEADDLPGLIADKYGDLVILQLLTRAMDRPEIRQIVVDVLRPRLTPGAIVERPDARIRELEEMGAPSSEPLFTADANEPLTKITFMLNGLRFHYDLSSGQKTGAFLDQRQNYLAAAEFAHGSALDICCYQGGFALHLARVCERVTGIDASRAALEVADQNLALNPGLKAKWIGWRRTPSICCGTGVRRAPPTTQSCWTHPPSPSPCAPSKVLSGDIKSSI